MSNEADHSNCLACDKPLPAGGRVDRRYCDKRCNARHYKQVQSGKAERQVELDPVTTLARMTPQQVGWVAGIVEGEGSITTTRVHKIENDYIYPLVQVGMTDSDVVHRLREWTGLGRVSGPHLPPCRADSGHQPAWFWRVNKIEHVEALLSTLWPLLGERRHGQVDRLRERMANRVLKRPE